MTAGEVVPPGKGIRISRISELPRLACWIVAASLAAGCAPERMPKDVDWRVYLGDSGRQHYSPLTDIHPDNVADLELAWVYDSGEPGGVMYTSPLVVDGVLYGLSPQLAAFALNAASGEEIWRTELELTRSAQRGLMWWSEGGERRLFFTAGRELIALDADDGELVAGFGAGGRLDLTPQDDRGGHFAVTVPGVVFEDKIMLGFSTSEWADSFPGSVRAFSAIDGELIWQFDAIPAPGAPGAETWAAGALATAGGANVWSGMTLDEERGLLFAPTGSATPDFVGAPRLGDNLYANCLLALDARTGERKWHYQVVRHDLWDRDNPAPPTLVRLVRDGETIDAVALTTKSGHLYVFDRETGESLYPIVEEDTLPSIMPGERPAPKQPVSTVAFSRQQFEVTNRTPKARQHVLAAIEDYDVRRWAPPRVGTVLIYPWYDGGAEWGGSAFDPEDNRLILNANDAAGVLTLTEIPAGASNYGSYAKHCGSCHGLDLEGSDAGRRSWAWSSAWVGRRSPRWSRKAPAHARLRALGRVRASWRVELHGRRASGEGRTHDRSRLLPTVATFTSRTTRGCPATRRRGARSTPSTWPRAKSSGRCRSATFPRTRIWVTARSATAARWSPRPGSFSSPRHRIGSSAPTTNVTARCFGKPS